jgi:GTP-binding protein
MVEWCEHSKLPLHILLTKADKLNFGAAKNTLLKVQKDLSQSSIVVTLQLFSALNKVGIDDVHQILDEWFGYVKVSESE